MPKNAKKYYLLAVILTLIVSFGIHPVTAQNTLQEVSTERTELQKQLADLEKEITSYQKQLTTIKGQKNTLNNKISQLKKQQEVLTTQIKISTLQISYLDEQEISIQKNLDANKMRAKELRDELAISIAKIAREESRSFIEIFLTSDSLADAFAERNNYLQLTKRLGEILKQRDTAVIELSKNIEKISEKREEKNKALSIQALQQKELVGSVNSQSTLLKQTKGKESTYQAQLTDKQKEAASIKNRLYQLLEVSKQITFGEAVSIAQWAGSQTGVRAAFLLAVLSQESSLGQNVGTCNRAGDPASKSWRVVMKPERDHEPFKTITSELGLPINTTPVSCPMKDKKGNQLGWGGAMGPAQFIPSTWMGYRAKVTAITGKPANPWDIRDAFLAAGIKLKADGAGSVSGEWTAAMKYFSGGTNKAYSFYGDNVVAKAADYAKDIEKLK